MKSLTDSFTFRSARSLLNEFLYLLLLAIIIRKALVFYLNTHTSCGTFNDPAGSIGIGSI